MYSQALRVALQLMLFRGNPADFPYSSTATRMAALFSFAAVVLLMSPALPLPVAMATGLGGVAGLAFFTRQLLRANKLENRFAQLFAAQAVVGGLFALAMWPAFASMAPAMLAVMNDPQLLERLSQGDSPALEVPQWAALCSDVLFFWNLAVSVRINRLGADLRLPSSWLLTLVGFFVLMSFVMLGQLLAMMVLGGAGAVATP
jgi:hypothetical protein